MSRFKTNQLLETWKTAGLSWFWGTNGGNGAKNQPEKRNTSRSRGFKRRFMEVCVFFQIRIKPTMSQNDDIYQKNSKQSKGQGAEISQSWLKRRCFVSLLLPWYQTTSPTGLDPTLFGFRRKTRRKEPSDVPLKPEKKRREFFHQNR